MESSSASTEIDPSKLGPAGTWGALTIIAKFGTDTNPANDLAILNDSGERDFVVTCVFSKETGFSGSITGVVDPSQGTSFFQPLPNHSDYSIRTPSGTYSLITNPQGEFSGASFTCRARTIMEAKKIFLDGIVPFLDHVSYIANVPIILARVLYNDEKNAAQSFEYMTPYQGVFVNPSENTLHPQMQPVYALYREAKNTMSPLYRFLCYYKILEGIYNHLRPEVFQFAKTNNINLTSQKEVIPGDREIIEHHRQLVGRGIKDFFDRELTTDYRNPAAHYIIDVVDFLSVSDPTVNSKYLDILWPVEVSCRIVIAQQESYYTQIQTELKKKQSGITNP